MTFYQKEVIRIRSICYSNDRQIETVIKARNFIDNNFEQELNLNLLAQIGLMSKFHLQRLFKRHYGLTPKQYLIDKRIGKSKKLLKNGITVTHTCFAVGFESLSSFSTLFKTKVGVTPTEFQKSNFREVK